MPFPRTECTLLTNNFILYQIFKDLHSIISSWVVWFCQRVGIGQILVLRDFHFVFLENTVFLMNLWAPWQPNTCFRWLWSDSYRWPNVRPVFYVTKIWSEGGGHFHLLCVKEKCRTSMNKFAVDCMVRPKAQRGHWWCLYEEKTSSFHKHLTYSPPTHTTKSTYLVRTWHLHNNKKGTREDPWISASSGKMMANKNASLLENNPID